MKPFLLGMMIAAVGSFLDAGVSVARAQRPETPRQTSDPKASDPKASEPKASEPKASEPKASEPKASNESPGDPSASDANTGEGGRGLGNAERPEWEIKFQDDLRPLEYARELDFFGIEVGAIGQNGEIQYASQLSKPKPLRRLGAAADETRTHTTWKVGTLGKYDANLLTKAGIASKGKTIAHYYPVNVTRDLMALERAFADREQRDILRTRFKARVKPDNDHEYEFYVEEQDPRQVRSGQ